MKIYVVTSGYYSDYHIEMATVDKNKAEAYYKCLNDSSANIEEYDDGNITVEPIWYVYGDNNGRIRSLLQDHNDIRRLDMSDINKVRDEGVYNTVYVRAKDGETAKKIAIDLFAQYRDANKNEKSKKRNY